MEPKLSYDQELSHNIKTSIVKTSNIFRASYCIISWHFMSLLKKHNLKHASFKFTQLLSNFYIRFSYQIQPKCLSLNYSKQFLSMGQVTVRQFFQPREKFIHISDHELLNIVFNCINLLGWQFFLGCQNFSKLSFHSSLKQESWQLAICGKPLTLIVTGNTFCIKIAVS